MKRSLWIPLTLLAGLGSAAEVVDLGKFPDPRYKYMEAFSMSDDGKVAGGFSGDAFIPDRGWIWTADKGLRPIDLHGMRGMHVHAVSGDGRYFAGSCFDWNTTYYFAGEVSRPNDYVVFEAFHSGMASYSDYCPMQEAPMMKMSRDGTFLIASFPAPGTRGRTWGIRRYNLKTNDRFDLPTPIKDRYYWPLGLSADGSRIIATTGGSGSDYLWRSDRPNAMKLVTPTGSKGHAFAGALSDDGKTIVGGASIDRQWAGYFLNETQGTQWLRSKVSANGWATATNQDGTLFITRGYGLDVTLWSKPLGFRSLASLLRPSDLGTRGWLPRDGRDMSATAPIFLVQGTLPDAKGFRYDRSFIVRFSSMQELLSR